MDFTQFIQTLENYGLTDVLLPFLLIFTIIFAVLQKTHILGEGRKNFNVVVALVISLSVVIPHVTNSYPPDADVVEIMNNALPNVSIIIVAIIMVLILIGLMGGEARWMGGSLSGWIAIISFLIVIFIFGRAAGWFETLPRWLWWLDDPNTQALVVIILIFGIIIWFITSDTESEKVSKLGGALQKFGDFFKGK
jgi:hypothetical protein